MEVDSFPAAAATNPEEASSIRSKVTALAERLSGLTIVTSDNQHADPEGSERPSRPSGKYGLVHSFARIRDRRFQRKPRAAPHTTRTPIGEPEVMRKCSRTFPSELPSDASWASRQEAQRKQILQMHERNKDHRRIISRCCSRCWWLLLGQPMHVVWALLRLVVYICLAACVVLAARSSSSPDNVPE
jgi:hypothetical protein